ncbi:uncharacterized protein FIBRA_09561 [Fibroporia radiculosa]|uniref:Uncharacterized protein n=1 Tax=Fibroporia radiculosa TaxID=599839 RepID=J7SCI8_9APHY|nr:uncharacterized protein FIBRA_09561 [Fibroporia radiculosa]CCM07216.1 predicted protein [Fibroporia radiculosa]
MFMETHPLIAESIGNTPVHNAQNSCVCRTETVASPDPSSSVHFQPSPRGRCCASGWHTAHYSACTATTHPESWHALDTGDVNDVASS